MGRARRTDFEIGDKVLVEGLGQGPRCWLRGVIHSPPYTELILGRTQHYCKVLVAESSVPSTHALSAIRFLKWRPKHAH